MSRGWNRGRGLFYRPSSTRPELRYVNNGGRDAPLSARSRTIYRSILLALLAAFTILLVVSARG